MTDDNREMGSRKSPWEVRPLSEHIMHFRHLVAKYKEEFSRLCKLLQKGEADRNVLELRLKAALSAEKYERARAEKVLVTAEQYVALYEKERKLRDQNAKLQAENKELKDKAEIEANMLDAKYAAWERSAKESQRRAEAEQQVAREVAKEAQLRLEDEKEALKQAAKGQEELLRRKHEEEATSLRRELQCLRIEREEEINVLVLEHEHRAASQMDNINIMEKTIQELRAELSSAKASLVTQKARLKEERCKHSAETLRMQETNRTLMLQLHSASQQASTALPLPRSAYPQLSVARQRTRQSERQPDKVQTDPSGAPLGPTRSRRPLFESEQTPSYQPLHEQIITRRRQQHGFLQEQRQWMGLPETVNDPRAHPIIKLPASVCRTEDTNLSSLKPPASKLSATKLPVCNTVHACPPHTAERCTSQSKVTPPLLTRKNDFLASPELEELCLEDINFLANDGFEDAICLDDIEMFVPTTVSRKEFNPIVTFDEDKTCDRSSGILMSARNPFFSATASVNVEENFEKRKADLTQAEKPLENPCFDVKGAASEDHPIDVEDLVASSIPQQASPLTLAKSIRAVQQSVKKPKDQTNFKSKANSYFPQSSSKIPPVHPTVDSSLLCKEVNRNITNYSRPKYTNTIADTSAKSSSTHLIEDTFLYVESQIDEQRNVSSSQCIEITQLSSEQSSEYPTEVSPISYSPLNDDLEYCTNEETIATDSTLQGTAAEGPLTVSTDEKFQTKSVESDVLENLESFSSNPIKGKLQRSKFVPKRPTIFLTQHISQDLTVNIGVVSQGTTTIGNGELSQGTTTIGDGELSQGTTTIGDGEVSQGTTTNGDGEVSQGTTTIGDDGEVLQVTTTIGNGEVSQGTTTIDGDGELSQGTTTIGDGEVSQGTTTNGNGEVSQDVTQDCGTPLPADSFTLEKLLCKSTCATNKSAPTSKSTCTEPLSSVSIPADEDVLKTCELTKDKDNGLLEEIVLELPVIEQERRDESSVIGSLSPDGEKADMHFHAVTQCTDDSRSSPRLNLESISPPEELNPDYDEKDECLQMKTPNSHSIPSVSPKKSAKSSSEIVESAVCINESKSQDPDATLSLMVPNCAASVITLKYVTRRGSPVLTEKSSCSTQDPVEIETSAPESVVSPIVSGYKDVNLICENEASKPLTSLQQLVSSYLDFDDTECGVAPLPLSGEGARRPLECEVVDLPLLAINEDEAIELPKIHEYEAQEILQISSTQRSAPSSETASQSPTSKVTPKQVSASKRKRTPRSTDRSTPKHYGRDPVNDDKTIDTGKPLRLRRGKKRRLFALVDKYVFND